MNIIQCPQCSTRVLLAPGARECPSCRTAIEDVVVSPRPPVPAATMGVAVESPTAFRSPPKPVSTFSGLDSPFSTSPFREANFSFSPQPEPSKLGSDNPYLSPGPESFLVSEGAKPGRRSGLKWILFSFQGRIPRSTFWMASFGSQIGGLALLMPALFLADAMEGERDQFANSLAVLFGFWSLAVYIGMIWMSLAISVKRWHDRNKSGWWVLIGMIPYLGALWALVETGFLPGTDGSNEYGPDPLKICD